MTVVPLNARTAAKLAELVSEPTPDYVSFPPAARHSLTALKARVGDLDRIFAASATPAAMAARVDGLCAELMTEAQRLRRLAR